MSDAPVQFFVPGIPSGWARAAGGKTTHRFTPEKQRLNAAAIGWTYANGARKVFGCPVHLIVNAIYPRPKKHKPGKLWPEWKSSKPDIDNILKLVGDSLNGVAWNDDAQIVSVAGAKLYGDKPGLSIEIRPLSP